MSADVPAKIPKIKLNLPFRKSTIWLTLVLVATLAVAYVTFLEYIKPNEYGIMIQRVGINRGVLNKVYHTGLHPVIPFIQELHTLPKDVQILEMNNSANNVFKNSRIEKAAHIQTSDGFFVDVDVTILYRIADPYTVFTKIGPGKLYEENGILPKAEPILKQALGELTTEEFYNSPLRSEKVRLAEQLLNEEMEPKGLQIDHILVRYFHYSEEIQKNIEEKKLKDQLVFKNQAEANASREAANLKKIIEEGRKNVDVKIEEGKAYVAVVEGEIENYSRTKHSEADLTVKLAEAEKTRLKNIALRSGGSNQLVGIEMAKALKGLDVIMLPSDGARGMNPLDVNQNLRRFGVK